MTMTNPPEGTEKEKENEPKLGPYEEVRDKAKEVAKQVQDAMLPGHFQVRPK